MSTEMDKATLIHNIRASRDEMEALLTQLSETQMTAAHLAGDWSVKDLLSHITYWERDTVEVLQAAARGDTPYLTGDSETDTRNAQAVEHNRDRSIGEVMADYYHTVDALIGAGEAFPDADLFDTGRFAWREGGPLWRLVAGESYKHEREHREQLQALVAGVSGVDGGTGAG